jgi:hypothetical protein
MIGMCYTRHLMDNATKALIGRLAAKAEEKRKAARLLADNEYEKDMDAVHRLEALDEAGDASQAAPALRITPGTKVPGRDAIGPTPATREAIAKIDVEQFTVRDVHAYIDAKHPTAKIDRNAISSTLNKFVSAGEIELIKKSVGREPGVYVRSSRKESTLIQQQG